MENENRVSGWNIGIGLGFGALAGFLISAIIGMLRLSRPKGGPDKTATSRIEATIPPENQCYHVRGWHPAQGYLCQVQHRLHLWLA